jgi:hypothetical protein
LLKKLKKKKGISDDKTKHVRNNDFENIKNSDNNGNVRVHRYSIRHYYKDYYFAIKKKKK